MSDALIPVSGFPLSPPCHPPPGAATCHLKWFSNSYVVTRSRTFLGLSAPNPNCFNSFYSINIGHETRISFRPWRQGIQGTRGR